VNENTVVTGDKPSSGIYNFYLNFILHQSRPLFKKQIKLAPA
jgi:hypothetical protein